MNLVRFRYGDLLTISDVDVIYHQVNCLTTKPHGLSKYIADEIPWSDIYSKRRSVRSRNLAVEEDRGVPGTIRRLGRVVCFQAQWDFGGPKEGRRIPPHVDSRENREKWFKNCLEELGLKKEQKIGMPFKMGCGLAKGHWPTYLKMIKNFSRQYNKHIVIVVPHQSKCRNTLKTSGASGKEEKPT